MIEDLKNAKELIESDESVEQKSSYENVVGEDKIGVWSGSLQYTTTSNKITPKIRKENDVDDIPYNFLNEVFRGNEVTNVDVSVERAFSF
ncbi:hypothetical protein FF38_10972 [Lucilia cuprina]|uniref:Uncharacterized protein n=1 Tax=Lucilia cuprina TaxID=7375 RepID=A0A0L0BXC7_LUCCU|nr:hypothetical protein FF38_10972 [Lucilia cuprina]